MAFYSIFPHRCGTPAQAEQAYGPSYGCSPFFHRANGTYHMSRLQTRKRPRHMGRGDSQDERLSAVGIRALMWRSFSEILLGLPSQRSEGVFVFQWQSAPSHDSFPHPVHPVSSLWLGVTGASASCKLKASSHTSTLDKIERKRIRKCLED